MRPEAVSIERLVTAARAAGYAMALEDEPGPADRPQPMATADATGRARSIATATPAWTASWIWPATAAFRTGAT
jgi:hypothetical protein